MYAVYTKLKDGSWGIWSDFDMQPGDTVTVTKRNQETKQEIVGEIVLVERGMQQRVSVVAKIAPRAKAVVAVEDEGVYVIGDGMENVIKVKKSKAGNLYALRLKETGGTRITEVGEVVNFEWEYAPGLIKDIKPEQKMSFEQAKAFGVRFGKCVRCNRHLKAAESVEKAIGPVCAKWFGV